MKRRVGLAMFVFGVAAGAAYIQAGGEKAMEVPKVAASWTGEWGPYNPAKDIGLTKEKCKGLDCKVVYENGIWEATFEGECGRPYKYTIKMEGRQSGNAVLFKGSADLGEKDGGIYDWVGRAMGDEFIGFYTSSHITGVFHLAPKK